MGGVGGGYLSIQRGASEGRFMLFLFRHLFHICFLPSPMCPGTVLAAPRFGSLPGSFPVIPLKIYDSHKTPETARAQAPGGAAVLESLFEGADRLTLKVRCDPQMCHLVQKKLLFFLPGSAFSDGTRAGETWGLFLSYLFSASRLIARLFLV